MKHNCPISAQLVIPASFAECVTYEKQILWLKKEIENLAIGGGSADIDELRNQISMLENEVNSLNVELNSYNISAIQESIEQMQLSITNIANGLSNKQDKLTFDSEPISGSINPVTSDGIHQAIQDEGMRVEQLVNSKVDESTFNAAIQNIVDDYDTTEDVNQKLTSYATKSEISDMATKSELSGYVKSETLSDYATKQELGTYATKEELSGYVTEDELGVYVTRDDLTNYATDEELSQVVSGLATKEELNSKQNTLQFDSTPTSGSSNVVTSNGIYTAIQTATQDTVKTSQLAEYATKAEITDMATNTSVDSKLSNYATKEELTGYVTEEVLMDYATQEEVTGIEQQLSNYATNTSVSQALANKQDILTFDDVPTVNSQNPVTSDGIKKAIDSVITTPITVDSTVSQSSENPVSSNGIYNFVLDQMGDLVTTEQLATKQDTLTFDQTPTAGSSNVVTSNGIYTAIQTATQDTVKTPQLAEYATKAEITDMATNTSVDSKLSNYATKEELTGYVTEEVLMDYATQEEVTEIEQQLSNYATNTSVSQALANKQDVLTFDSTPTADSLNPVTSAGIYEALTNSGGGGSEWERCEVNANFSGIYGYLYTYIKRHNAIQYRGQNYYFCEFVTISRSDKSYTVGNSIEIKSLQMYNDAKTYLYSFNPDSVYCITGNYYFYRKGNYWVPNDNISSGTYRDYLISGTCIMVEI